MLKAGLFLVAGLIGLYLILHIFFPGFLGVFFLMLAGHHGLL